jgi:HAD superfamily hydrolase (TIGR01509 family)
MKDIYMNIIIPLGGKGERFSKNGFAIPKPLIPVLNKTMIEYVLDTIQLVEGDQIFIIYNNVLDNYDFVSFLQEKYRSIQFIKIDDTRGAVETLSIGIGYILQRDLYDNNKKTILLDCDTYYTEDILPIFRNANHNMVFYTKNTDPTPIYSYIELCYTDDHIIDIKEKEKISDNANTGAYAFLDISELYKYCNYVLDNNITFRGEPYTSCVISQMIIDGHIFMGFQLDATTVISLGTPTAIQEYLDKTYAFLFDLDGTIVITDTIYYQVWTDILLENNIDISPEIFKKYIQGNNDTYVLHSLLMNTCMTLDELSKKKDQLFLQYIDEVTIVEGSLEFIQYLKMSGHKICIVTNCNRSVAERIIYRVGIEKYIDFVIASEDCIYGKPNGEPYFNAMKKYNISNNKCIIFEDSTTGIISAKSVNARLLIGLETTYSADELQKYGCDFSISNYIGIEMSNLLNRDTHNAINQLSIWIRNSLRHYDIEEIVFDNSKLKG